MAGHIDRVAKDESHGTAFLIGKNEPAGLVDPGDVKREPQAVDGRDAIHLPAEKTALLGCTPQMMRNQVEVVQHLLWRDKPCFQRDGEILCPNGGVAGAPSRPDERAAGGVGGEIPAHPFSRTNLWSAALSPGSPRRRRAHEDSTGTPRLSAGTTRACGP